jgi:hypothetical protein
VDVPEVELCPLLLVDWLLVWPLVLGAELELWLPGIVLLVEDVLVF